MSPFAAVTFFAVLTVAGQLLSVAFIVVFLARKKFAVANAWLAAHAMSLMLVVALAATLGSLYFSDIAGWTPCKLCWYQRIFMYPQAVLLAVALWKRDKSIAPYVLALSLIGAAIAAVHYGEQVSAALFPAEIDPNVPCDESGTSCRSTPFFRFGYITIPMMALTAFTLNAFGSAFVLSRKR